jgi:hypothetical protein
VVGLNTSVDDVDAGTGTSRSIVSVRSRSLAHVGDTAETPRSTSLSGVGPLLDGAKVGLDDGVLLDVVDLVKLLESLDDVIGDVGRETTVLAKAVPVLGSLGQQADSVLDEVLCSVALHLDNVASGNGVTSARGDNWGRKGSGQSRGENIFETHIEVV